MSKPNVSRRDLLKTMLAVGGGLTVAAFLPKKWIKPVVGAGVSPVHAAASSIFSISWVKDTLIHGNNSDYYTIQFAYNDPNGEVSGDTDVHISTPDFQDGFTKKMSDCPHAGDGFTGTFDIDQSAGFSFVIWLTVGARETNKLPHTTPNIT